RAAIDEWRAADALFAPGSRPGELLALADRAGALWDHARVRLRQSHAQLEQVVARIAQLRDPLDRARFANFASAAATAQQTLERAELALAQARGLLDLVQTGRGTIGGLLHDHELRDLGKALGKIIKR